MERANDCISMRNQQINGNLARMGHRVALHRAKAHHGQDRTHKKLCFLSIFITSNFYEIPLSSSKSYQSQATTIVQPMGLQQCVAM